MAKTKITQAFEFALFRTIRRLGTFICFEVGINGKNVDCLTVDTHQVWKCYEIKITKSDFKSKNDNTFVGHFNYYVMPSELYKEVKDEIPNHIGVYIRSADDAPLCKLLYSTKRAKRCEPSVDHETLMYSIMKAMSRETEKRITDRWDKFKKKELDKEPKYSFILR